MMCCHHKYRLLLLRSKQVYMLPTYTTKCFVNFEAMNVSKFIVVLLHYTCCI